MVTYTLFHFTSVSIGIKHTCRLDVCCKMSYNFFAEIIINRNGSNSMLKFSIRGSFIQTNGLCNVISECLLYFFYDRTFDDFHFSFVLITHFIRFSFVWSKYISSRCLFTFVITDTTVIPKELLVNA